MINKARWFHLRFCEQMGHIGSEITRARIWEEKNDLPTRQNALERALELIDITKDDVRLRKRRRELCYLRELVADQYAGSRVYSSSLKDLEAYCLDFALLANRNK